MARYRRRGFKAEAVVVVICLASDVMDVRALCVELFDLAVEDSEDDVDGPMLAEPRLQSCRTYFGRNCTYLDLKWYFQNP